MNRREVIVGATVLVAGCASTSSPTRDLTREGVTNIEISRSENPTGLQQRPGTVTISDSFITNNSCHSPVIESWDTDEGDLRVTVRPDLPDSETGLCNFRETVLPYELLIETEEQLPGSVFVTVVDLPGPEQETEWRID